MSEMLPVPPLEPELPAEEAAAPPISPRWSVLTKFLVSMVLVVLIGAVLVRFQQMIAPLVLLIVLIAGLTVAGIAVLQQVQGLYTAITQIADNLPGQLQDILNQPLRL